MFNNLQGETRLYYHSADGAYHVDVFIEKFVMSHELELGARLRTEPLTLPAAELLLTKLQIAELNHKDASDTAMLLADHELAQSDGARLAERRRVSELCASNWGLYTTVTDNLETSRGLLAGSSPDAGLREQRRRADAAAAVRPGGGAEVRWLAPPRQDRPAHEAGTRRPTRSERGQPQTGVAGRRTAQCRRTAPLYLTRSFGAIHFSRVVVPAAEHVDLAVTVQRRPQPQVLRDLRDVVHAHDLGAGADAEFERGDRAREAVLRQRVGQHPDEVLARHRQQDRSLEHAQLAQVPQDLDALLRGLRVIEPGIDHQLLECNAVVLRDARHARAGTRARPARGRSSSGSAPAWAPRACASGPAGARRGRQVGHGGIEQPAGVVDQ